MSILDFFKKSKEDKPNNKVTNYIGFSGGLTYGLGFTFRRKINNTAFQTSGLAFRRADEGETKDKKNINYRNTLNSVYIGGGTFLYTLNEGKYGNLYVSLGSGFLRKRDFSARNDIIPTKDPTTGQYMAPPEPKESDLKYYEDNIVRSFIGAGPAIGMEFKFAENFVFSIELPLAFVFTFNNDNLKEIKFNNIIPFPCAALLYKF
jgi:hypothetical protein